MIIISNQQIKNIPFDHAHRKSSLQFDIIFIVVAILIIMFIFIICLTMEWLYYQCIHICCLWDWKKSHLFYSNSMTTQSTGVFLSVFQGTSTYISYIHLGTYHLVCYISYIDPLLLLNFSLFNCNWLFLVIHTFYEPHNLFWERKDGLYFFLNSQA